MECVKRFRHGPSGYTLLSRPSQHPLLGLVISLLRLEARVNMEACHPIRKGIPHGHGFPGSDSRHTFHQATDYRKKKKRLKIPACLLRLPPHLFPPPRICYRNFIPLNLLCKLLSLNTVIPQLCEWSVVRFFAYPLCVQCLLCWEGAALQDGSQDLPVPGFG